MAKHHINLQHLCDDIRCVLADFEIELVGEKEIDYGYQMRTVEGVIINIYVTGKVYLCGDEEQAKELNNKVLLKFTKRLKK